jgi:hypothetical protein
MASLRAQFKKGALAKAADGTVGAVKEARARS